MRNKWKAIMVIGISVSLAGCTKSSLENIDSQNIEIDIEEEKETSVVNEDEETAAERYHAEQLEEWNKRYMEELVYRKSEIYPSVAYEELERACKEVIEEEKFDEFLQSHAVEYQVLDTEEKEMYRKKDVARTLNNYCESENREDEWFLVSAGNKNPDIIIRFASAEAEWRGDYIYYMFMNQGNLNDECEFWDAIRALGYQECYFINYGHQYYLVLPERNEDNILTGVALHDYSNKDIFQIILYLKIKDGNQVEETAIYTGGLTDGKTGTTWPEYQKN